MEADDLMAAVFPTLAACQETVAPGPIEIPDHPLVRQTLADCLHEAMDIDGLRQLVAGIEAGRITVITRDTTEPSVLAHEILNGMPYTYLDDETEAANRRSRQVKLPRGLPVDARDLARLDPLAIARVCEQVRPQLRRFPGFGGCGRWSRRRRRPRCCAGTWISRGHVPLLTWRG